MHIYFKDRARQLLFSNHAHVKLIYLLFLADETFLSISSGVNITTVSVFIHFLEHQTVPAPLHVRTKSSYSCCRDSRNVTDRRASKQPADLDSMLLKSSSICIYPSTCYKILFHRWCTTAGYKAEIPLFGLKNELTKPMHVFLVHLIP